MLITDNAAVSRGIVFHSDILLIISCIFHFRNKIIRECTGVQFNGQPWTICRPRNEILPQPFSEYNCDDRSLHCQ